MKAAYIFITVMFLSTSIKAQINAKLMKYMDVSESHITFVYGGDIWIVDKDGGQAVQITHSPGEESYPKFSPDGSEIAYSASYNGNVDVYRIPSSGGLPVRLTYASYPDRMIEWHPDGNNILFASRREAGIPRVNQFYLVDKNGGMPERISVPYGELAAFSEDGSMLAYITKITENYPFKRYRGGLTSDVILFDLNTNQSENITNNLANDGKPAWVGNKIYYLSDKGENMRRNIWSYDIDTKQSNQITQFTDFDISYLSAGPKELVFEVGGNLYLMDANSEEYREINVQIVSDLSLEISRLKDVSSSIQNMTASPGGKRILLPTGVIYQESMKFILKKLIKMRQQRN
jgi:tricorn protease